jgi:hypothetical protein
LIRTIIIKHSALVFPNNINDLKSFKLAFNKKDVKNIKTRLLNSKLAEKLAINSLKPNEYALRDLLY